MSSENSIENYLKEKAKYVLEFHKSKYNNPEVAYISKFRTVSVNGSSQRRLEFKVTIVCEGECFECDDVVVYSPKTVTNVLS